MPIVWCEATSIVYMGPFMDTGTVTSTFTHCVVRRLLRGLLRGDEDAMNGDDRIYTGTPHKVSNGVKYLVKADAM